MPKLQHWVGKKFGRVTVLRAYKDRNGVYRAHFRCSCGREKSAQTGALAGGATRSCGCLRRETSSKLNITHGAMREGQRWPEYNVWNAMHQRCRNPNVSRYPDYGGRGIRVCRRWRKFSNFLKDMGRRPDPLLTLDRINNDGNYSPSNCRWATRYHQEHNKRNKPPRP